MAVLSPTADLNRLWLTLGGLITRGDGRPGQIARYLRQMSSMLGGPCWSIQWVIQDDLVVQDRILRFDVGSSDAFFVNIGSGLP